MILFIWNQVFNKQLQFIEYFLLFEASFLDTNCIPVQI